MARDYKKEYATQKARGEHPARMERQKARRAFDEEHAGSQTKKAANGKSVTNTASKRKGKDLSHKKALSKGGSNKDGVTLESPSKNRARNYQSKKK
tara:strand:+ start:1833 stop:2120 length:288 start_codon:yes stop_codon:yes gene_type:complete